MPGAAQSGRGSRGNRIPIAFIWTWQESQFDHGSASGDEKYAGWFEQMHERTFNHFPDPAHGGWYGYSQRDGSVSTPLKGGMWKGFFHTPPALWLCWKLLGEMLDSPGDHCRT